MASEDRLKYILNRLTAGNASEAEYSELLLLLEDNQTPDVISMLNDHFRAGRDLRYNTSATDESKLKAVARRITSVDRVIDKGEMATELPAIVHRVHFLKTAWFRYAVAIVLLVAGSIIYFNDNHDRSIGKSTKQAFAFLTPDAEPGYNRAVLTLSNGQKLELDSASHQTINDGVLSIDNNNGQLQYSSGTRPASNTMTTPKGGQYRLVLADGSKVWLNAASSITYPAGFTGGTREVTLTGEAYFEIVADAKKPFVVNAANQKVLVLGTSFNVNAYANERNVKTSLLSGSVKINDRMLKPGEAFVANTVIKTNAAADMAWKNGVFMFNEADLPAVMRQLERWYDIEVQFSGPVPPRTFGGELSRDLKLSQILKILKAMGLEFTMQNGILTVKSD